MKTLFTSVSNEQKKTAYKSYTLQHGIESIQLLVPLKSAEQFKTAFSQLKEKKKSDIIALVESLGGKVKG